MSYSFVAGSQLPLRGIRTDLILDQMSLEKRFGFFLCREEDEEDVGDTGSAAGRLSALSVAVKARLYGSAAALMAAGADPSLQDGSGLSPYARALYSHAKTKRKISKQQVRTSGCARAQFVFFSFPHCCAGDRCRSPIGSR